MEFRSYINVLGPFSLFSPILITCGVASSRRRQISPVWTGFPVRSRPDWGTSLLSSNSLLVLVALCWVLGEVGQVLPVPVRILGAAPSSSQPNECFQLRAPCTTPPPNLPVPEGTTLCPQLTTRESAWLCVFEQKVDREKVLENSRVVYAQLAYSTMATSPSVRLSNFTSFMLVSRLLLKMIPILLSLLDPKLLSASREEENKKYNKNMNDIFCCF